MSRSLKKSLQSSPSGRDPAAADTARPRTLRVGLGARSYDIVIGAGLVGRSAELLAAHLSQPRVAIVTDRTVASLHLDGLRQALDRAGIASRPVIVPPGEATKALPALGAVIDELLAGDFERSDLLVAFGGGVVGDLAGLAAAVIHRGVRFVQMPTTLLAQVDSSVGGKTGINVSHGKNLIGAFHQPVLVISDTDLLATLPARELRAGYAELVKHGFLGDRALVDWLAENRASLLAGGGSLARAIELSCAVKARIVEEDEREGGRRALLNLGHTFAHAFEAALGYGGELLHGEAVAIGVVCAFELSARLGLCPPDHAGEVRAHLDAAGLETSLARLSNRLPATSDLVALMGHDKKVLGGRKRLVLARAIGEAFLSDEVADDAITGVIDEARRA